MATYNYKLDNFVATPTGTDTRIVIYDKNDKLKYSIEPEMAYFFAKANMVIIKIEDRTDIILTFQNNPIAVQAAAKLNEVKKYFRLRSAQVVRGDPKYSRANLNMRANNTTPSRTLACDIAVLDETASFVRVFVNGVEVNVGDGTKNEECYFSADDGATAKELKDHAKYDKLYWNALYAEYELEDTDEIDFVYLTY